MASPAVGEVFVAKNGKTYEISQVVGGQDTTAVSAWVVLSNQDADNYHKKIPATRGLEESRFAIEWDNSIPGWKER
jgi:hypothetical protein